VRILNDEEMVPMKLAELFSLINYAITTEPPDSESSQIICGLRTTRHGALGARDYFLDPKFAHLHTDNVQTNIGEDANKDINWRDNLRRTTSLGEAIPVICEALKYKLSKILAISEEAILESRSIFQLGVDSLVAVELRNWLLVEMKANIPTLDILRPIPLIEFAAMVGNASEVVSSKAADLDKHHSPRPNSQMPSRQKSVEKVQDIIESYRKELSLWQSPSSTKKSTENEVILLTGASGTVGTILLDILATSSKFSKVCIFVRGHDIPDKMMRGFDEQGLDWEGCFRSGKIEIFSYDMGDPFLGLDVNTYQRLSVEVTTVIHNAWNLNFLSTVEQFEDPYLRGLLQ
jgi:Male sterility protein/Phosphopantetheine attachment site